MGLKEKIKLVVEKIGLTSIFSDNKASGEDWNKLNAAFKEEFGEDLADAVRAERKKPDGFAVDDETQAQIAKVVNDACASAGVLSPSIEGLTSASEMLSGMVAVVNNMAARIEDLGKKPESAAPVAITGASMSPTIFARTLGHTPHSDTHLFGIECEYFKRGTWWNELVATGKGPKQYTDADATDFRLAFHRFSKDFSARCQEVIENNQVALLDYSKMIKGESFVDFTNMNAKLGEFTVRRFDMIIAYLRQLSSVSGVFRMVSNVQNQMTAPTAHFGELSQSYLAGHHFKGAINLDGEIYHVDNAMFKFRFDDPRQLEKEYIGHMNREGSNPMKWNFFEWCIVHFGTQLHNEDQRRRVVGVMVPRQGDFPQPSMFAHDGALRAIERVEEELKVLPFEDLNTYDETSILDYIRDFWAKVSGIIPNMNGLQLYVNEKHRLWYIDAYRERYGRDTDFSGQQNDIRDFSPRGIVWVPNMAMTDYKMWITYDGNVENYEDKPFEMYALYFQQDLETLIMASWWKGGAGVLGPGVQFASLGDLKASGRKLQWLFTNFPATSLSADATVIDGGKNTLFVTGANTAATTLANMKNIATDRVYKIVCGDTTNATKIVKSGNFDKINSDWTPTAVGDYIKVYAELHTVVKTVSGKTYNIVEPTGHFLELGRKVTA